MFKYKITGQITWNEAETEAGRESVEIEETIEVEERSASGAFEKFLEENEQYEFYGSLKTCDAETGGEKGATYIDQNEDQTIDIDLVSNTYLREAREKLGLSQQKMAELIGAGNRSTYTDWEYGKTPTPGPVQRLVSLLLFYKDAAKYLLARVHLTVN